MTTTETKRFRLRERLNGLMEEEHVTTLMDSLPPIGWDRLATKEDLADLKEDLADLEERLSTRFDAKFVEMRGESKLGRAKQTYVILVGGAAMLAAALTPIYLALFSGGG